jgi:hypothetical protein
MRYEFSVTEPGQEPEKVICCQECSMAAWQRDSKVLTNDVTNQKLRQQIEDKSVEITKPVRIPDPPDIGRGFGLDPPGYDPGD